MSHIPNLDPMIAAKKGFSEIETRIRRFWTTADVAAIDGGWAVQLDGRTPKTPAKQSLILPTEAAARLVADEWVAQGEYMEPATMPATRLASTAIDRIGQAREAVADEIAAYAGSDAICYLGEGALERRQAAAWTPWRDWAERELGVQLAAASGIVHVTQSPEAIARVKALALALDDFTLTGLATATPLLGSAILALALQRGALAAEMAFELSRLEEAFQEGQWGVDAEAAERADRIRAEAIVLQKWFEALN